MVLLHACTSTNSTIEKNVEFRKYYEEFKANQKQLADKETLKTVSFSATKAPLDAIIRKICQETEVSVVISEELKNRTVTAEITNEPVNSVLEYLARSFSVQMTNTNNVYFIGKLDISDRAFFCGRVRRLSAQEWKQSIDCLLSQSGRSYCSSNGLLTVSDVMPVINRVSNLVNNVHSAELGAWICQLYIYDVSFDTLKDLGLENALNVNVAYSVGVGESLPERAVLSLLGTYKQVAQDTKHFNVSEPLFVLVDGGSSYINRGRVIRLPRKTVSDQGTVTTNGYDEIQTGLQVSVNLREVDSDKIQLGLKFTQSSIVDYQGENELPVIDKQTINTSPYLSAGKTYLVGSLTHKVIDDNEYMLGFRKETKNVDLQIWAKVYKIKN